MKIDYPNQEDTPALFALWQEAFEDDEAFLNGFFEIAFSPMRCRCLWQNGRIVAALYWFDCQYQEGKLAYLYGIATAKAERGRGFCHALLEDTHRHLRSCGYRGAILVPGSPSLFKLYEQMGYSHAVNHRTFSCNAAERPVALQRIEAEEYAAARRLLLPPKAVVQEGETLAFLKTQASFYRGDGFLLAANIEDTALNGLELLGSPTSAHAFLKAPAIVCALGCQTGSFRMPGSAVPFALFRALAPTQEPPSYFAFAFDQ